MQDILNNTGMDLSSEIPYNSDFLKKELNMEIKDSGERRVFESGAVRDIQEGKGRCDLLPIREVAEFFRDPVLRHIANFYENRSQDDIYYALATFSKKSQVDVYTMILNVSKHYEDGCKKYGERNWQKGIPCHCYLDSAIRHYLKYCRGDNDEPHDRAFVWNLLGLLWTMNNKPGLIDIWGHLEKESE